MDIIINKYLIDNRNSDLWLSLNQSFNISVEFSADEIYSCYTKSGCAIIYVDRNNLNPESFTHELLHLYLDQKDFYLGSSINNLIVNDQELNKVFSQNVIFHLTNCLDHVKMFSIYKDMGYDENKFLLDYNTHKMTNDELNSIKSYYKYENRILCAAADLYIGKLFAMLCDVNDNFNYRYELSELEKLDNILYNCIYNIVQEVKDFDIDKSSMFNSYIDLSFKFYESVNEWYEKNKFV